MLWPGLMGPFGDVIGLPFALEGVAFFTEAIFIAIYLYGWKRMPATWHYRSLYPIVVSGLAGAFFIVSVNGWMNSPAGFSIAADGSVTDVSPLAAMFNSAAGTQYLHMLLASYMVSGFLVAGTYAWAWLRNKRTPMHRLGFTIAFGLAAVAAPLQVFIGDVATRRLVDAQPAKFAALELLPETQTRAPLTVGGWLIDGEVAGAIEIPGLASFLGTYDFGGEVPGLDSVPPDDRPPDRIASMVHLAFQVMVGIGTGLLALSAWYGIARWRRKRLPRSQWFWRAAAVSGLAAVASLETGWMTTELGRQPWIVQGVLRVEDAVTNAGGIIWSLTAITVVYIGLGAVTIIVLRSMVQRLESGLDAPAPYGPAPALVE